MLEIDVSLSLYKRLAIITYIWVLASVLQPCVLVRFAVMVIWRRGCLLLQRSCHLCACHCPTGMCVAVMLRYYCTMRLQ